MKDEETWIKIKYPYSLLSAIKNIILILKVACLFEVIVLKVQRKQAKMIYLQNFKK